MKNLILIVSLLIPSLVLAQYKLQKGDTSKVIKIGAEQNSVARWKDGKKMVFPQEKPEVVKEKVKPNILTKEEKVSMSSNSRAAKGSKFEKGFKPEPTKEKMKSMEKGSGKIKRSSQKAINSIEKGKGKKEKVKVKIDK